MYMWASKYDPGANVPAGMLNVALLLVNVAADDV